MRLATYNVEWFSALFDENDQPEHSSAWSARRDVTKAAQLDAIAHVFRLIDADCVLVVEAPDTGKSRDTEAALLAFARRYNLRLDRVLTGFLNDTQQEIALFFDSRKLSARHDPVGPADETADCPRFDGVFQMDVDIDGTPEAHRFSKPPLEAELTYGSGQRLRLIGVHIKSKAPHGAANRDEEVRISIANRRKQLAQSLWLRRRVEHHLGQGDDLIVLGDFNDGPGLDAYEKLFGHSSVEVVLGAGAPKEMTLFDPHAIARLDPRGAWSPSTARFYVRHRKRYLNALLDFVMVSHRLCARKPSWRIWHPFDDPECFSSQKDQAALLTASDHFPVTLDLP